MNKYVVIYYATPEAMAATADFSPDEMQAGMKKWFDWAEEVGDALVDFGTPLGPGTKVTSSGSSPSSSKVTGYSIVQAESKEEAEAMLSKHPHLGWAAGCEIEVHESMPMPTEMP